MARGGIAFTLERTRYGVMAKLHSHLVLFSVLEHEASQLLGIREH
jgi:hypothetical protein